MRRFKLRRFTGWLFATPERLYLVVAIAAVLGFAFITPPFQGPDEEAHYVRAQYISRGYLVPVNVASDKNARLPAALRDTIHATFFQKDIRGRSSLKYDVHRTIKELPERVDNKATYQPVMVPYSPIPYLPAVPLLVVSNMIKASPLVGMYLARISLGLASVAVMYFAIRIIPRNKYLLTAVALLPMLLFQQSVVSADGFSYATLALFVSYVLYLRSKDEPRLSWRTIALLVGLSIVLALAKNLLFIFLPLALLATKNRRAKMWIAAGIVAGFLFSAGWNVITKDLIIQPSGVDSAQQMKFIEGHPFSVVGVAWNSYMTDYGNDEAMGVVGIFGYADTVCPLWLIYVYIGCLVVLYLIGTDYPRSDWSKLWRIVALVLSFVYFCAVNAAMYLTYTPPGFAIVYGTQGRYFLPIVIVVAAMLVGPRIVISRDTRMRLGWRALSVISVMVMLSIYVVLQRYYLYTP